MGIVRRTLAVIALLIGVVPASATEPAGLVCPAPISTCQQGGDAEQSCPAGYRCACVPSCPACRDCPVQVCVPEVSRQCQTACDCSPGLMCDDGRCVAGFAPVFCCESDRCPLGQQCQHRDGRLDRCGHQCQTACDCEPGLGCFDGQCIAGFAPVFCCESDQCPADQQCQHRDGRLDRCGQSCITQAWRCDNPGGACEQDRVCMCSASCPDCEDCGPGVCMPRGSATPYRCRAEGGCSQPGDRCQCVSSCPECDDCALSVCVPGCDPMCARRQRISSRRIDRVVDLTRQCSSDAECVAVDTSSGCRSTCGAFVNQRYADRIRRLLAYLDQRYCASFTADGCSKPQIRCATQQGACIEQRCTAVRAD
jgi:hypothetical protein